MADPMFHKPQKIDILIGGEIFFELLCVGQIKPGPNLPIIQKTSLGWIVSGKCNKTVDSRVQVCHVSNHIGNEDTIESIVQRFWELEAIPNEDKVVLTKEQQQCEEHFRTTVCQLKSGRLQVSLPFKEDPSSLGWSFETAKRRFLSLERRLSKEPSTRDMYHDFMKEYLDLGHMSITDNQIPTSPHYFIPHQVVLRPQSTSTKLRVVFDASSRSTSQKSLNDLLMVGPTIQNTLYSTLLRFRLHEYVLTADIEKMYRQVFIVDNHRDFQLILWREKPEDPIQIFRLNTITYGTSSAPFSAIRCLSYLSEQFKDIFPIGSKVLNRDFYVDDLLTGANNLTELSTIQSEIKDILSSAGFNLTKWFSNHPKFEATTSGNKVLTDSESTKALGIHWAPKNDSFEFHLDSDFENLKATKRNILSVSSRLFDPLGLLCPIVVKAKVLLQELWVQKLDWDESIPMKLDSEWEEFKSNLLMIDSIKVPRFVHTTSSATVQIHGFSDASMRAYGCCIYVRSRDSSGVFCDLLTAKSKIAPLKTKSLPRLELCAAHLLAKLWSRIKEMLCFQIESVYFWTDSEITLHWIKTHPSTLTTFVSNRVAEIQEWSELVSWRHVPTKSNPADVVSRGSGVDELKDSIWFKGPTFLMQNSAEWPVNAHFQLTSEQESLEKKKSNVFLAVEEPSNSIAELIEKFSSYKKLLRVTAYVLRFVDGLRKRKIVKLKIPTAQELTWSFYKLVEIIQRQSFSEEICKIQKSLVLPSNLQRLTPFIHDFVEDQRAFSLLRVGGRLLNAPLPYDTKFPLLLPKGTAFVTLYLRNLHISNCHAGSKALVSLLRDKIWLINAKEECSRIVRKCVHCFRYKPKLMTQIMGNLPTDRVRAVRPFVIVGVDFCGPVNVTLRIRGKPPIKMYIAVYVCFTSKAVHLELVSDLTSDAFILSFQRFAARRGLPTKVYCDNATNFVGASRGLKELEEAFRSQADDLVKYAAERNVEFIFIPPRAPHFGGLWEAAVKQAKFLLLRAVGNLVLTTEEMVTMLAEVEAVLNSRPIAPLSPDPNDGEALTPAHLIVGEGLRSLPHAFEDVGNVKGVRSWKRWRMLSALKRTFWQAWSRDYVLGLQGKAKWHQGQPNLRIGDLVIIHEDNLPPQKWLTGRVVSVIEGQDGKVRVAEVQANGGVFKRPIAKLAVLPVDG